MPTAPTYRTNRDLFSNHYLDEHLPETEAWNAVDDEELRSAREEIRALWEREKDLAPKRNEAQLEEKFVRPLFRKLGIPFEVEESTSRTRRRPDYGFFASGAAAREAFDRREAGGDFYETAVGVADAKRWGRPLDTRGGGEHDRDFENPSYQVHVYLQETPARWAVLTDGRRWRLYHAPTSHRLDSYYEVDLPAVLEGGDLDDFRYFYLFFRHEAFLEDAGGDCFLDDVYGESAVFARELGEDLQANVYEAITVLAEGFLQYPDNDLDEETLREGGFLPEGYADFEEARLETIHDSCLIYLYRLIFVLYAESEGRDLLDTDNEVYEDDYSLTALKREVAGALDGATPTYRDWQDDLWSRLDDLFVLIDRGSESRGIPREDLHVPAYNGGLFRTDPDADDGREARFLAEYEAGDASLARVIDLLARSENGSDGGKTFVDYSSLDVRHLGSIYEGLLEYELNVAGEPLAVNDDGEYVPADEGEAVVETGEVYLTTDAGERKATGSYYTPEYVVEYVVENTLGPLVDGIREDLAARSAHGDGGFAEEFARRVFDLKVLDPAMGSGHFLTSAVDYLAREIIDAQEKQAAQRGIGTVDEDHDVNWARRQVAQRCIYGVDLNPLAVELAKVSLWLRTLAADQPLAFLDHHLKTGNSLVGSDVEAIEELDSDAGGPGGNATLADFGVARKGTIEQLMGIYRDFVAIENRDLADVKEMEAKYDEFERNELRQRLEAMANVHTAEDFGLDGVPDDAYERMAAALTGGGWERIEASEWFRRAQRWAGADHYFHWKLEFPEVFYDEDGSGVENPGFDAVVGNPPYVNITLIPDDHVSYLKENWDTAFRRFDLYVLFSELAYDVGRRGARHGYVVPDKLLTESYGERWRETTLNEHGLERVLDLREEDVFEDATNAPIVFTVRCGRPGDSVRIEERDGTAVTGRAELPVGGFVETPGHQIRIDWTEHTERLLRTMRAGTFPLSRVAYASWGAQPGNASRFVFDERPEGRENVKRLIKGGDVDRYAVRYDGRYLWYDREELHRPAFPELFENEKVVLKKVAGKRGLVGAFDGEGYYTEDSVINVVRKADLVEADEDVLRARGIEVVDEPRPSGGTGGDKTYDRDATVYSDDLDLSRRVSLKAVLGVVNSTPVHYYYANAISGRLNVFPEHVRSLPIAHDEGIYERLADRVSTITDLQERRGSLNLDLLDYLGGFGEGTTLRSLDGAQPAPGVADTVLARTKAEHPNLRVGSVRVEREGPTTTVLASARYKPDDEEAHETDRWGYAETDPIPALEFVGLDDETRELVHEFVPRAVEEAGGFADFRETATKTKSLVDRLGDLTLPALDDVEDGLGQYVETKARAERLDEEIAATDAEIDDLVYDLYGLSDEAVARIESSVRR